MRFMKSFRGRRQQIRLQRYEGKTRSHAGSLDFGQEYVFSAGNISRGPVRTHIHRGMHCIAPYSSARGSTYTRGWILRVCTLKKLCCAVYCRKSS
ncbi:hypothetical protein M405DRAFT_325402 [Rhizopogon salebrosus TDB-379]|nr:hypothetical protein M405DRAFT_325402 [Rhizopogon salebrosus TDB-379]